MNRLKFLFSLTMILVLVFFVAGNALAKGPAEIIHDAEYYVLEAQHGKKWAAEDKELEKKLAKLRKKHGTPPNIIHIMWDDTAVGEVGVPQIQKARGWETPNINKFSAEG
ncbi:MAG: sulfatase, partial [Deltaproteobacteria bacterium]|nr:sulfatase [Deltaproteobacteria bacterium]